FPNRELLDDRGRELLDPLYAIAKLADDLGDNSWYMLAMSRAAAWFAKWRGEQRAEFNRAAFIVEQLWKRLEALGRAELIVQTAGIKQLVSGAPMPLSPYEIQKTLRELGFRADTQWVPELKKHANAYRFSRGELGDRRARLVPSDAGDTPSDERP